MIFAHIMVVPLFKCTAYVYVMESLLSPVHPQNSYSERNLVQHILCPIDLQCNKIYFQHLGSINSWRTKDRLDLEPSAGSPDNIRSL